jgi:hypothetical protein
VTDLSPLAGMNLQDMRFTPKRITKGMAVLRQAKTLKSIGTDYQKQNTFPPEEFWKKLDAGDFHK